jgi:hypothetical protein
MNINRRQVLMTTTAAISGASVMHPHLAQAPGGEG